MMKKIFLLLFLGSLTAYSQLNPVKKITFGQWYVMPHNCYVLSWTPPDSSFTDTLVGYNVYRNDSLYRYTTDTIQKYVPCIGDTSTAYSSFLVYHTYPFYIHVNAVYNSNHVESVYTDSAECGGLMIGIHNNYLTRKVSPNPFSQKTTLQLDDELNNAEIILYDNYGKQVRKLKNLYGRSVTISRDNLAPGIYFVQIVRNGLPLTSCKLIVAD